MASEERRPPDADSILVVDDQEDNVELLRARLVARGYYVRTATDGQQALDLIRESPPDLVLLDVMMPKMSGIEVVRRIKSDESLPFIAVIMQTALDSTENRVEGLDAGADDYITKPINFAELEARVRSMLRIKRLQEDLESRERELEEMNDRLRRVSQTDGLTGLDNRRYLEERLHEMFEHSLRLHEPLSVVMCDIDHFKSVNDTYGHLAGDAILRQFADLISEQAREIDRVGRYGGEEFLIILPGTVLDAAVTFAERVREEIGNHVFVYEAERIKRTVSCGVAAWPHPLISSRDQLIRSADDALYVAKERGRDRVVRFDSEEFKAHSTPPEPAHPGVAASVHTGS
ncbi:MAG: diguanylate cyclase [Gemmatimonadaceae bacterium]